MLGVGFHFHINSRTAPVGEEACQLLSRFYGLTGTLIDVPYYPIRSREALFSLAGHYPDNWCDSLRASVSMFFDQKLQ